jgi:hypothetical protein
MSLFVFNDFASSNQCQYLLFFLQSKEVKPVQSWEEATCIHSIISSIFTIFFLFFSAVKETTPFSSQEGSTTEEGSSQWQEGYNLYQEEG